MLIRLESATRACTPSSSAGRERSRVFENDNLAQFGWEQGRRSTERRRTCLMSARQKQGKWTTTTSLDRTKRSSCVVASKGESPSTTNTVQTK